jgi:hypothetical protein
MPGKWRWRLKFMRTQKEIECEISALKALKPIRHIESTKSKIALAIEELESGVDDTADEWSELSDSEQDIVNLARAWKAGDSSDRPSEGWDGFVER